ncbi:MAG: SHOCT domain-containing protein [Archaeoglobaceae archaeon]
MVAFGPNELILLMIGFMFILLPALIIIVAVLIGVKVFSSRRESAPEKVADEIKKLAELHDQGVITEEEFNEQKRKLLGK